MKTIICILLGVLLSVFHESQAKQWEHYNKVKPAATPKKVVQHFLNWYKQNREHLEKFHLVAGKPGDSTNAYRVDFSETAKYLAELRKSGFVSESYINTFRKYFETADANLKKYPQFDGPGQGFGIDLVLQANDYGEILDHLKKAKYIEKHVNPNSTKVYVRFPTVVMLLKLTKTGNTWLIDSLDYV